MKPIIKIGAIVGVLAACIVGGQMYLDHKAQAKVTEFLEKSDLQKVSFQSASIDLFTQSLIVTEISAPGNGMVNASIEKIVVHKWDDKNEKPSYVDLEVKGLVLDPDPIAKQSPELAKMLDLKKVRGNLRIDYRVDEEAKTLSLNRLAADVEDFFALEGNLHLGNFDESALDQAAAADQVVLKSMNVSLEDQGAIDFLFKLNQIFGNSTLSRKEWADQIELMSGIWQVQPELDDVPREYYKAAEEVVKFLRSPGVLSLRVAPTAEVSLGDYDKKDPVELAKALNFAVSYQGK